MEIARSVGTGARFTYNRLRRVRGIRLCVDRGHVLSPMLPDLAAYRIPSPVVYACVLLLTNSTVHDSPGSTDQSPVFGEYDSRCLRGSGISTDPVASTHRSRMPYRQQRSASNRLCLSVADWNIAAWHPAVRCSTSTCREELIHSRAHRLR